MITIGVLDVRKREHSIPPQASVDPTVLEAMHEFPTYCTEIDQNGLVDAVFLIFNREELLEEKPPSVNLFTLKPEFKPVFKPKLEKNRKEVIRKIFYHLKNNWRNFNQKLEHP